MFRNVLHIAKCWLSFVDSIPLIIKCGLPLTHDNSSYSLEALPVAVLCCIFVCKPYFFIIPSTTQNSDAGFSFHNTLVCHMQGITVEGRTIDIIINDMLALNITINNSTSGLCCVQSSQNM
jgi:hypothetical protein